MNFKPFYIKHEDWMTDEQVAEVFDKAVKAGATLCECVYDGRRDIFTPREYFPFNFDYFGVSWKNETFFEDCSEEYGDQAVELTLEQVDEHLGITSPVTKLRNVKIDLRKEDGSVDEEKSAAFQKAVFETGGMWNNGETEVLYPYTRFMFVNYAGKIHHRDQEDYFINQPNTEIDFQYETITTWSATEKANKETVEIDGDVYFK